MITSTLTSIINDTTTTATEIFPIGSFFTNLHLRKTNVCLPTHTFLPRDLCLQVKQQRHERERVPALPRQGAAGGRRPTGPLHHAPSSDPGSRSQLRVLCPGELPSRYEQANPLHSIYTHAQGLL